MDVILLVHDMYMYMTCIYHMCLYIVMVRFRFILVETLGAQRRPKIRRSGVFFGDFF